jgi:cytochrome c biogenesis protein CcdA
MTSCAAGPIDPLPESPKAWGWRAALRTVAYTLGYGIPIIATLLIVGAVIAAGADTGAGGGCGGG